MPPIQPQTKSTVGTILNTTIRVKAIRTRIRLFKLENIYLLARNRAIRIPPYSTDGKFLCPKRKLREIGQFAFRLIQRTGNFSAPNANCAKSGSSHSALFNGREISLPQTQIARNRAVCIPSYSTDGKFIWLKFKLGEIGAVHPPPSAETQT